MIIQLAVTPFAKRCIEYDYGQMPIVINRSLPLFQNLSKRTFTSKKSKSQQYCTELLELDIPSKLAKHIEHNNIFSLGYMLHSYEMDKLLNTVLFSVHVMGNEAMTTISNYFDIREVSEDDYAQRTAYRAWQRYESKKTGNSSKNRAKIKAGYVARFHPLSYDLVLRDLLSFFDLDLRDLRGSILKTADLHEVRNVILFLLYKLTKTTLSDLSKSFLFSFQKIHHHIKDLDFIYNTYDDDKYNVLINDAFEYIAASVRPLPIEDLRLRLLHDNK